MTLLIQILLRGNQLRMLQVINIFFINVWDYFLLLDVNRKGIDINININMKNDIVNPLLF
jgi:hypothetical protein